MREAGSLAAVRKQLQGLAPRIQARSARDSLSGCIAPEVASRLTGWSRFLLRTQGHQQVPRRPRWQVGQAGRLVDQLWRSSPIRCGAPGLERSMGSMPPLSWHERREITYRYTLTPDPPSFQLLCKPNGRPKLFKNHGRGERIDGPGGCRLNHGSLRRLNRHAASGDGAKRQMATEASAPFQCSLGSLGDGLRFIVPFH